MNLLERRHIARLGKELDPDSSLSFPFCPEHHLDGGVGGDDDDDDDDGDDGDGDVGGHLLFWYQVFT